MMKITEQWKKNKRKIGIVAGVITGSAAIVAGIVFSMQLWNRTPENMEKPDMPKLQDDGSFQVSGTTMVGMVEDTYDIDYLKEELYIEAVYLKSGNEVKKGDSILKFSEDTVTTGQKQLESEVTTAGLAYKSGLVKYNLNKADAQADYDLCIKKGELAESSYADAITGIEQNLSDLEKQIADKQEELQENQDAVNEDTYYEKYDVGYKKDIFETNYAIFYERVNEWNLAQYLETCDTDYSRKQFATDVQLTMEEKENVSLMTSFLKRVYTYQDAYEKAEKDYEAAKREAGVQVEKLKVEIESLQLQLQEAQLTYEADMAAAKAEYEMAKAESEAALRTYQTTIERLDEELQAQLEEKEDAEDKLTHFEKLVGDGYFRASSNGTALVVMPTKSTDLTENTMVMAYSNPDTVTVSVAVDQMNIATLAIADEVTVTVEGFDDFAGSIAEIQPISASDSVSSVTYTVKVTLKGDVSQLEANLPATVTFLPQETETVQKGGMPQ